MFVKNFCISLCGVSYLCPVMGLERCWPQRMSRKRFVLSKPPYTKTLLLDAVRLFSAAISISAAGWRLVGLIGRAAGSVRLGRKAATTVPPVHSFSRVCSAGHCPAPDADGRGPAPAVFGSVRRSGIGLVCLISKKMTLASQIFCSVHFCSRDAYPLSSANRTFHFSFLLASSSGG